VEAYFGCATALELEQAGMDTMADFALEELNRVYLEKRSFSSSGLR
jgi:hypothetical protein